jgi:hypothetical protein
MTFKITTLDKRHTGSDTFKYMIPFTIELADLIRANGTFRSETFILRYLAVKDWFCVTYGDTANVDTMTHLSKLTVSKYCWSYQEDAEHNRYRIYIKDDKTLLSFQLKWS